MGQYGELSKGSKQQILNPENGGAATFFGPNYASKITFGFWVTTCTIDTELKNSEKYI